MAIFLDVFLSAIALFFVAFAWVYYCLREVFVAFVLATVLSACGGYLIFRLVNYRSNRALLKKQKKAKVKAFAKYLCYCTNLENLFEGMLKYYTFYPLYKRKDCLVCAKNNQRVFVALCFVEDSLSKNTLRNILIQANRRQCQRAIIFCNGVSAQLKDDVLHQIPFQFVDIANTFALFEQAEKLPPLPKVKSKSAYTLQYAFNKKRFGWYLGGAIYMVITSVLTFFSLYSLVWATVMLFLALYSLLNKRYNAMPTAVTLK